MAGHYAASPGYPYDLEKAKALVAESAGKDGFSAKILVQAGEAVDIQVCQLVAAALAEIGGHRTRTGRRRHVDRPHLQRVGAGFRPLQGLRPTLSTPTS